MGTVAYGVRDAGQKVTRALPNGSANVTSSALDLQNSSRGSFLAAAELLISAPAMGATPMPDAKTMKYDIIHSDNADLSSSATLFAAAITQTGASGAGCAAATFRWKPPSDVKRYIGVKATGSAAGDATASSFTIEMLF